MTPINSRAHSFCEVVDKGETAEYPFVRECSMFSLFYNTQGPRRGYILGFYQILFLLFLIS